MANRWQQLVSSVQGGEGGDSEKEHGVSADSCAFVVPVKK